MDTALSNTPGLEHFPGVTLARGLDAHAPVGRGVISFYEAGYSSWRRGHPGYPASLRSSDVRSVLDRMIATTVGAVRGGRMCSTSMAAWFIK